MESRMFQDRISSQYILLKYVSSEKYANDFLNGILYMNSLEYFWNEYNTAKSPLGVQGQADLFEGNYCNVDVSSFGFPKDFCDALVADVSIRAEGYKYCHVHCYYRLDYTMNEPIISYYINPLMNDFGEYVIIIEDEKEFLERVNRAITAKELKYLCGNVRYHKPMKNGKEAFFTNTAVVKVNDFLVDINEPIYKDVICAR